MYKHGIGIANTFFYVWNGAYRVLERNSSFTHTPGAVAESVEHWSPMRVIVGSNTGRVKPMTYKIDIGRFLARCSALLE